jgi:uncharacterized RDD family membrane protein YckC
MMRRFASRGARVASYFADVLLIALAPALFFYPAYFWLVPETPKPNLLPLELMNTPEKLIYQAKESAYQQGILTVGIGTLSVFLLAFILYQTIALLSPTPDGSSRGQTFGMRAVSTRVLQTSNQPIRFHHALCRGLLFAISATLLLASIILSANLLFLFLFSSTDLPMEPDEVELMLMLSAGVILFHLMALIPKRSLIDWASGTCQTALYGDLVEKEHR